MTPLHMASIPETPAEQGLECQWGRYNRLLFRVIRDPFAGNCYGRYTLVEPRLPPINGYHWLGEDESVFSQGVER